MTRSSKSLSKPLQAFGQIDILVHAIGFANRDELNGPYYNTSRAGFHLAMDISVYSFTALARAFQPILRPGGSLLTLTYYGSEKVSPHYNVMGVAKAALEASVRYLAYDLGKQERARQCHLCRADPHPGGGGCLGFQDDVPPFCRAGPAARECHH